MNHYGIVLSLSPEKYSNYVRSSDKYSVPKLKNNDPDITTNDITLDEDFKTINGASEDYKIVDDKWNYGYLPSLSNNISAQFEESTLLKKIPSSITAGYTAETNCIGFAKNAAIYSGNNYINGTSLWGNITPIMWGEERIPSRYPFHGELSFLITKESDKKTIIIEGEETDIYPLEYVEVGDIIYYVGSGTGVGDGRHIMIISEIIDTDEEI